MKPSGLTDEEILERIPIWTSQEVQASERAEHGEFLVSYCRGDVAETAVRRIVEALPPEEVERLVAKHVVAWPAPSGETSYCRDPHTVAQRLADLGFSPAKEGTEEWLVGWPGGEKFTGQDLCPLALLVVWIRRMRESDEKDSAPSY